MFFLLSKKYNYYRLAFYGKSYGGTKFNLDICLRISFVELD